MDRHNNASKYLAHILNTSPCKTTHSFDKSNRFINNKSYSPNKFYNIPNTRSNRVTSMGFGKKQPFKTNNNPAPNKYQITGLFENNKKKGSSFGIGRQQYYLHSKNLKQIIPPPGRYNITNDKKNSSFYIGKKIKDSLGTLTPGPTAYQINSQKLEKLSNHNRSLKTRIRTQYYEKEKFHAYDNKTPGPGSYLNLQKTQIALSQIRNTQAASFSRDLRFKPNQSNQPGPGNYPIFSVFGDSSLK